LVHRGGVGHPSRLSLPSPRALVLPSSLSSDVNLFDFFLFEHNLTTYNLIIYNKSI
jgi:hypothetical protein